MNEVGQIYSMSDLRQIVVYRITTLKAGSHRRRSWQLFSALAQYRLPARHRLSLCWVRLCAWAHIGWVHPGWRSGFDTSRIKKSLQSRAQQIHATASEGSYKHEFVFIAANLTRSVHKWSMTWVVVLVSYSNTGRHFPGQDHGQKNSEQLTSPLHIVPALLIYLTMQPICSKTQSASMLREEICCLTITNTRRWIALLIRTSRPARRLIHRLSINHLIIVHWSSRPELITYSYG